jgi:hypothetical protein
MYLSLPAWRAMNDIHRSTGSDTTADVIARRCGLDFAVLDRLSRDALDRPAYVAYVDVDSRHRAPQPVCTDDLRRVKLRLTPSGVGWAAGTTENQAVQRLAGQSPDLHGLDSQGPTLHLSTLLGDVPDLDHKQLRYLQRQKIVRLHYTTGPGRSLAGDDITAALLTDECRQVTVTLTPRGRWLSARPTTAADPGEN